MNTFAATPADGATAPLSGQPQGWFAKTESWLDARGKGAWIAAMVLSFVFFWPLGLALLAYMIWSKRMFSGKCGAHSRATRHARAMGTTGNAAFDSYKTEMLRRLEDEQASFEEFLQRLREAKDKSEFDQFMGERAEVAKGERAKKDDDAPVEA